MTTRTLLFCAQINPQTASALMQHLTMAFNDASVTDILIAFTSTGGDVHSGVALHGLLRAAPKPVVMHAIGSVASIGVTVYLGAAKRRATNGCLFYFHPMGGAPLTGPPNRMTMEASMRMLEADEARLAALWGEQTRLDPEIIRDLFRSERMMPVQWGRDHGLVREVADLTLAANVNMVAVAT
jgi:ATP-dependent protease ClpP protease subunit